MTADKTRLTFELRDLLPGEHYCAECAERLCAATSRLYGVLDSGCDTDAGTLEVVFDAGVATAESIGTEVARLGSEITEAAAHAAYRLTGLD